MNYYNRSMKKGYYCIIILAIVFVAILASIFLYEWAKEEKKYHWVKMQQENLDYIFDKSAPHKVLKLSEEDKLYQKAYETSYDFNGDGTKEAVQIAFAKQWDKKMVTITVEGTEPVQVELDCPDGYQMSCVITGIQGKNGNSLGIVESVFAPEDGKGYLNCHIFSYNGEKLQKSTDYTYSGLIGGLGMMDEGIVENAIPGKEFCHDVDINQNGYVYERSVMFADMKDVGLYFPYETVGKFQMGYRRNVTGLFYVILR